GGQAAHAGGAYLPVVEQRQRAAELLLAVKLLVAEGLARPGVAVYGQGVAAEFAEHDAAAELVRLVLVVVEVQVYAAQLAAALVVPAAGAVEDAGGVQLEHRLGALVRVELSPALVEYDPGHDAGGVIQVGDHV